jgi:hypothetical protein
LSEWLGERRLAVGRDDLEDGAACLAIGDLDPADEVLKLGVGGEIDDLTSTRASTTETLESS